MVAADDGRHRAGIGGTRIHILVRSLLRTRACSGSCRPGYRLTGSGRAVQRLNGFHHCNESNSFPDLLRSVLVGDKALTDVPLHQVGVFFPHPPRAEPRRDARFRMGTKQVDCRFALTRMPGLRGGGGHDFLRKGSPPGEVSLDVSKADVVVLSRLDAGRRNSHPCGYGLSVMSGAYGSDRYRRQSLPLHTHAVR